ncbi:hypothetical protein RCF19_33625, partial [Rhodococcus qingshengii]
KPPNQYWLGGFLVPKTPHPANTRKHRRRHPRLRANGTFVASDRPNVPFTPSGAGTPPAPRHGVNGTLTLLNEGNGTFTPSGQELGEDDAVADARSDLLAKV